VPRLIKRSAPHFLLTQILEDAQLFEQARSSGVMQIIEQDGPK